MSRERGNGPNPIFFFFFVMSCRVEVTLTHVFRKHKTIHIHWHVDLSKLKHAHTCFFKLSQRYSRSKWNKHSTNVAYNTQFSLYNQQIETEDVCASLWLSLKNNSNYIGCSKEMLLYHKYIQCFGRMNHKRDQK